MSPSASFTKVCVIFGILLINCQHQSVSCTKKVKDSTDQLLNNLDLSSIKEIEDILYERGFKEMDLVRNVIKNSFTTAASSYTEDIKKLNTFTDLFYVSSSTASEVVEIATLMSISLLENVTSLVQFLVISDNAVLHHRMLKHLEGTLHRETKKIVSEAQDLPNKIKYSFERDMKGCLAREPCLHVMAQSYDLSVPFVSSVLSQSDDTINWERIMETTMHGVERVTGVVRSFVEIVRGYINNREEFIEDHLNVTE